MIFQIAILEHVTFQSFIQKKYFKLGLKMPFWVNLGEKWKKLLSYLKSGPSNLSNVMFHCKQKKFEFGTKNGLFQYF